MIAARLRAVFQVRPDEVAAALWAALTFCAILTATSLLRPVRDALVLDGDPAFIPWLFTATFIAMLALAPPWGALVARQPRGRLVAWVHRSFAVQLLIFAALVHGGVRPLVVGKVFYVWVSVMNLFGVSVFWSLCADLLRPEKGRRLFAPIAAGGTAGALLGPIVTRALAHEIEPALLLIIAALLLEAAVWSAHALVQHVPSAPPAPTGLGGSAFAALPRLVRSPYLLGIGGYALCTACLATFVYLRQAGIVKEALPDRAARTAFFANVELATAVATMVLQLVITARLLRWLGVGLVLAALPLVQGLGVVALVAAPSLAMAIAVSASGRAATHALARPSRELLFTALPREDKYRAKNVIDTLVYRFGDFSSAWLHHGLVAAGVAVTAVAVPLAAGWAALALALGRGHRRRVEAADPADR
ncbi:MAG: MFS transporter [Myxococcales bacterium]|nr:MFS transporter [Myxococcales bacterium]